MLVTRSGFRAFNEYDLSRIMEAQLARLREEVKAFVQSGRSEEIPALAGKYKLTPLAFDTQNLTVDTKTADIPAEYFPNDFWVKRGQSYPKEVLQFYLPFIGDPTFLRCVPSTRILWTEEIALEDRNVAFELIKFTDDVGSISKARDRIVDFLTKQAEHVNRQIEQHNNAISQVITETETQTHSQISKHEEFLSQLGTPTRESQSPTPVFRRDRANRPSHVTEKKTQSFDVFICHTSADKEFVDRLATALKGEKISAWYDSFQIGWGDDLRPVIDDGLKNSRFGIVVFSKAFLSKKKWTEYELNGLFSKEKKGRKVILPIWHDIMREDIAEYSPTFADRIAKRSDNIPAIVKELHELLK